MLNSSSTTSKLIIVDLNDTIIISPEYPSGNILFEFVKVHTKFDWGEVRVEYDNLEFKNIKIVTKEYNNSKEEPATICIEKLLLLDDYTTTKNIILLLDPVDDIIITKIFYEKLLKNTLFIPTPNNLTIDITNNNIISEFKTYLEEYCPNLLDYHNINNTISYFKNTLIWNPNSGYNLHSLFDKQLSTTISNYIKYKTSDWINLTYNESSYTKYTHPIYSLHLKLNSKKITNKLIPFNDLISTSLSKHLSKEECESLNDTINQYSISYELKEYINNSISNITNINEYQRDLKLYKYITQTTTTINSKPWCPIFIIPTENDLVITATKIASTFLIKNYQVINKDIFKDIPIYDRSMFSFSISSNYQPVTFFDDDSNIVQNSIKSNILQKYDDITSNSDTGIIHILYRNPFERYVQSLYQDIQRYLTEVNSSKGLGGIINLFTLFIKNAPNEEILIKKLKEIYKQNETISISDLFTKYSHSEEVKQIVINIVDGLINSFFNRDNTEISLETDITILNTYGESYKYNVLTPHYTPYLTNVLELYNSSVIKSKFKFVDIDTDNLNNTILDNSDINNDDTNITPVDFKNMWKTRLINFLNDNPKVYSNLNQTLNSDLIAYNSIKKIKNNTQLQSYQNKTSYVSPHAKIQLTSLNNNIVITAQKIASSWVIENYHKINTNVSELSYEEKSKLDMKYRGVFEVGLNTSKGVIDFTVNDHSGPLDEQVRNKIRKQNSNLLTNILDRKCNDQIYILYRNPEIRYVSAISEDINTYLGNINFNDSTAIINFYLSFIKNLPNQSYKLYEKLIYDMTSHRGISWLGGLNNLNTYMVHRLREGIDGIETLYTIIINGIMDWFFNGFDYSKVSLNTPFSEINSKNNELGHVPIYFRNHITQHYTPYLSPLLDYYNRLGQPSYIHFLDIDTDDINDIILKKSDEANMSNKTPNELKKIWNTVFNKHLKSNRLVKEQISNHLLPDILAYNTIKNIKK